MPAVEFGAVAPGVHLVDVWGAWPRVINRIVLTLGFRVHGSLNSEDFYSCGLGHAIPKVN